MSKYTAKELEDAQFARHPAGGRGHLTAPAEWRLSDSTMRFSTSELIKDGWVPVPTKPAMTRSTLNTVAYSVFALRPNLATIMSWLENELVKAGVEIKEPPTNTEKLVEMMKEASNELTGYSVRGSYAQLAEYLDANGVKAGN